VDKLVPDKYNPTRCAQRVAALLSYCSLLLVVLAVFASDAAKVNIEPGNGVQATDGPTEGWFSTPYVKATCEGAAGNHTYIATMFEVCQGTGWPYEGTVICYDYNDGVAPPGLRPNADHWDVVSKTMGTTAFGLYLCTLLCQAAMAIMMTCILCCRMCGGLPTLIYTVGGTAGLTLVLQIALMADINENLISSTGAWKCTGADASPVEGVWLTMVSFFVNLALFLTCFWPVCKCICPCLKKGDDEEEDGGDEGGGDDQVSAGGGKKMVV
jgi:hypothetical protein